MNHTIEFTSKARKQLQKLDKPLQRRIINKIKYFKSASYISVFAERLSGFNVPTYRFRVGDYRLIFIVEKETVTITNLGHRRDVYKK